MVTRPVPPEEKVRAVSPEVIYEMKMFTLTGGALMAGSIPQGDWRSFVLIESWVQHFRNLHEFFYGRGGDPEIVRVDDFYGERPKLREEPEVLRGLRNRANVEMSHLSYGRSVATEWNVKAVCEVIEREIRTFIAEAPERLVPPELRNGLEATLRGMPREPAVFAVTTSSTMTSTTVFRVDAT